MTLLSALFAYLDPGSGSLLSQLLVGGFAAAGDSAALEGAVGRLSPYVALR